jgi:hypothetical protein
MYEEDWYMLEVHGLGAEGAEVLYESNVADMLDEEPSALVLAPLYKVVSTRGYIMKRFSGELEMCMFAQELGLLTGMDVQFFLEEQRIYPAPF